MNADDVFTALIVVGMAMMGALARMFYKKNDTTRFSIGMALIEMFLSAFTALMLFWITRSLPINNDFKYALGGVAGWAGPKALEGIIETLNAKTGLKLKPLDTSLSTDIGSNATNNSNKPTDTENTTPNAVDKPLSTKENVKTDKKDGER
ncbi:hypothetical protein FACS1894184_14110 [Clostridia bacterium]|nr:hypothetical protein FACS1894184_14110 [Clostridia bacterium]